MKDMDPFTFIVFITIWFVGVYHTIIWVADKFDRIANPKEEQCPGCGVEIVASAERPE